jgi:sulfatase modifying factor 1
VTPNLLAAVVGDWSTKRERTGDLFARAMPLPRPRPFQLEGVTRPTAVSRGAILPSGYLTGLVAKEACQAAGKRLCTKDEWKTACRGEAGRRFPYGDAYREGACNVARPGHPASILHGHASLGHLDPRLGRVELDGAPGLLPTGSLPGCASRWGGDALFDMVGNLDEWLDAEGGAFAGGFYARGSKSGCDAIVDSHPPSYLDYSTGVRCCRDPRGSPAAR